MNPNRDADTILAAWVDEGPLLLPDETRRAIVVGARTATQRRSFFPSLRRRSLPAPAESVLRFGAVLGGVALVALLGLAAWNGQLTELLTGGPSPLPSPTATSTPTLQPVSGPAPAGLSQPGAIAYSSDGRIRLVDPATGDHRALTPVLREIVDERLSTSCALDGGELTVIEMAWSPDGRALAFVPYASRERLKCGVFLVSEDGDTLLTLLDAVSDLPVSSAGPTILGWSPDGASIALGNGESTFIVSIDGDNSVDLGMPCRECTVERSAKPGWSRDGTRLAVRILMPNTHKPYSVAVVEVASGNWTWLWPLEGGPSGEDVQPFPQTWLTDDALLVLAGGELFAIDSNDPEQWTSVGFQDTAGVIHQAWKPGLDLFAWNAGGDGGLFIHNPATGDSVQPIAWSVWGSPTWAPDGSHQLAVIRANDWSVWLVDADNSDLRRIAQGDAEGSLAWQPVWPESGD